jgi:hypothetical protein
LGQSRVPAAVLAINIYQIVSGEADEFSAATGLGFRADGLDIPGEQCSSEFKSRLWKNELEAEMLQGIDWRVPSATSDCCSHDLRSRRFALAD